MTVPELLEVPPAVGLGRLSARRRLTARALTAPVVGVILLMILGAAVRFLVARQSMFADELSTYWIVATHGFGGVISLLNGTYPRIPHAEITPPLFFIASWLSTQLGHSPELVRAPSLVAGVLTIPAVYLLGARTVGRPAALLAAAFTTLSPFMIYYSSEARSYAVMMLLATLSTLAMLRAAEVRRLRWWVGYAVLSCAAFYTHYTCVFYLVAQFLWLAWVHPDARRPAVLANLGAIAGLIPWTQGLINDLDSPTEKILSVLSPFTPRYIRLSIEHWAIGFPYVEAGGLQGLPGVPALVLMGLAATATTIGVLRRAVSHGAGRLRIRVENRTSLIFLLALSVPLGDAAVSAVSTHLFGVRNLAASWPALALSCATLVTAAGPRLRYVAAVLAVAAFMLAAGEMLTVRFARPDFRAAAGFIDRRAAARDVVIDATAVLSPGPLSGLDIALHRRLRVLRAFAPAESDHPFGVFDAVTPPAEVVASAVRAAHGARVLVVAYPNVMAALRRLFPASYHLAQSRLYPEFIPLALEVWAARGSSPR